MIRSMISGTAGAVIIIALSILSSNAIAEDEAAILYPWSMSASAGMIHFEGDEELEGGIQASLQLGYDYNDRWSLECSLYGAPDLAANSDEFPDQEDASLIGLAFDSLFHFTRWERLDPFLSFGIGYSYFTEELEESDQGHVDLRGGLGLMYHISDTFSLRADYRGLLADYWGSSNGNSLISAGLVWHWSEQVTNPAP